MVAITTLWVLGAPSIEMTAVEQLLKRCDQHYVYAMRDGQRVTRSQAYAAESLRVAQMKDLDCVFLVECIASHDHYSAGAHVLDHHRPTSRGFGLPPARALEASSLGQAMSWISLLYGDRGNVPPLGWTELAAAPAEPKWTSGVIGTANSGGELCCRGRWFSVPDELRYVAAADHCLWPSYRGEVPGVDPDSLFRWRIESRASSEESMKGILKAVMHAQDYLRRRLKQGCVRYYHEDGSPPTRKTKKNGQSEPVILCDQTIPELHEAAARERLAVLYPVRSGTGKRWVLVGARPATVQCWMERQRSEGREPRGVPELGWATCPFL